MPDEQTTTDAVIKRLESQYHLYEDHGWKILMERLAKCEAARKEACYFLSQRSKQHISMEECPCNICKAYRILMAVEIDAARAALEAK